MRLHNCFIAELTIFTDNLLFFLNSSPEISSLSAYLHKAFNAVNQRQAVESDSVSDAWGLFVERKW